MMRRTQISCVGVFLCLFAAAPNAQTRQDMPPDPAAVMQKACADCHAGQAGGEWTRISGQRKTPEGWTMTLVRMQQMHDVRLNDDEFAALLKHLSDTQGLAPAESAPYRYLLERQPNVVAEDADGDLSQMCARCHSYGRFGLQRRTQDEWLKLAHFHLGQWPTIEYQALGRDRNWWEIASTSVPESLARYFPLQTEAWRDWQAARPAALAPQWRFVGQQAGRGDYAGTLGLEDLGGDRQAVTLSLEYADGVSVAGRGQGILYTGYEWRATIDLDDGRSIQVVAARDPDSGRLAGRWFYAHQDGLGGSLLAAPTNQAGLLAVQPAYLRAGDRTRIRVQGTSLSGAVDLGAGVRVVEQRQVDAHTLEALVDVAVRADEGARRVSVGNRSADGLLMVYQKIDSLRVEPAMAIARVGGNGGPIDRVPAQFQAVAYLNGGDGQPGTDDDLRIGVMPANWSVSNANETAEQLRDTEFAGRLLPTGLYQPAAAGPNPQRPYSTNNAGDLNVQASVMDGQREVQGSARLIVTVQRWNDPPIR